jgi:ADP-L-glycero-D-manno-heptose 6-epimerase
LLVSACPAGQDVQGSPLGLFTLRPAEVARLGALGQREGSAGGGGRMLLVTGGAGFIGSNLVAGLNEAGRTDIVVNDALGNADKWRNLGKRQLADVVPPGELIGWLDRRKLEAVIHLGAISDTTATDADAVLATNFRLSLALLDWCTATRTPFIYASSAATYGDGSEGFDDDWSLAALRRLKPMNLYGFSKHLFDLAVVDRFANGAKLPPQWVGLKFFNVFGPNEYHKGEMTSLVAKRVDEARAGKCVRLFKSHRDGVADGEQKRDFIYVDDAVAVMRWLLDTPSVSGIFNVGTGKARSFRDLITAMFRALGREPDIEYVDMPAAIRRQYQYFTQAKVENLRRAGYNAGFTPLEEGVNRYVTLFLNQPDRYR